MRYPTGNNKREENFLDNHLRANQAFEPEDYERLLHTYRTLGGVHARMQARAESDLYWIGKRLERKEVESND